MIASSDAGPPWGRVLPIAPINPMFAMNLLQGLARLFVNPIAGIAATASTTPGTNTPMQLDDDLLLCDDLPAEAKQVLDAADRAIADVRSRTDRAIAALREEADRRAEEIKRAAEVEVEAVQAAAAKELSPLLRDLFHQLKAMQAEFMKDGKLDEALAVRNRLRGLRSDLFGVKPDPGNLTEYSSADFNKALIFEVVGSADGNIWGTDLYTGDSRLAVAAVHAGAVRVGERALVRVTLSGGSERVFEGSERYGIRSLDYGNYSLAFAVERI